MGLGGLGFCSLGSRLGWAVDRRQEGLVPGQSLQDRRSLGSVLRVLGELGCSPVGGRATGAWGGGTRRRGQGAVADSCLYLVVG